MSVKTTFEIGENIKRLREFRGYSQEYMATELNVSQRTYGNIESDKGKVNKSQIEHIAKILDVDPIYLMTYDDKIVFRHDNSGHAGVYTTGMFNTNYNVASELERELYDKRIEELKERINELKTHMDEMKKDNAFLRSLVKQQYDEK